MPNTHLHTNEQSRYEKLFPAAILYSMGLMMLGLVLGWWIGGKQSAVNAELVTALFAVLGTAAAYCVMKLLDPKLAKGRWEQTIVSVKKPVQE